MATRVGPGGPPPSEPSKIETPRETQARPAVQGTPKGEQVSPQVVDSFERVLPLVEKQLQAMVGKPVAGQPRLSSAQLAAFASAFAALLADHPRASRKQRAALFVKALIKQKRLGRIIEHASEEEIERMAEAIAQQLDGAPFFAKLVEDVSEGARKLKLG